MQIKILIKILGGLWVLLGGVVCVPALFAMCCNSAATGSFVVTALMAAVTGSIMLVSMRGAQEELNHRTALAVVALSWISTCLIGAMPFYLSGILPHFVDAVFESTSGFTGTGASVIADVEATDRALLLWRSMTQWLGGMGIILFFIAILPLLGIGGVQLFRAEITGPQKDKITPRVRETAKKLWLLYLAYTLMVMLLLREFGGMPYFDAINHAFTTLATGGFSTKNNGIAFFESRSIDLILAVAMVLASINFALHFRLVTRRDGRIMSDTELRWYLAFIAIATAALTAINFSTSYKELGESFRHSFFVVASTASTTGYSNADYTLWPYGAQLTILLLMLMGGMSGSTAGGLKCIRVVAALKQLIKELTQIVHPKAVLMIKTNQRSVPVPIVNAIWGLIFLYFLLLVAAALTLSLTGLDLLTSISAAVSALSNVGPGLGQVGPTNNYASLPYAAKAVLSACMVLGRLEFYTVLVLFTPAYWRR